MRVLPVNSTTVTASATNAKFIVLGAPEADAPTVQPLVSAKINKTVSDQVPGVWATLGMENSNDILWQGTLQFSKTGNDQSTGKTLEQVEELYHINDRLNATDSVVTERFINFDDIHFPEFPKTFTAEQIPNLRLTVFLQPDEGALVFFQHYKTTYQTDADSDIEYILPQPTPGFTTNRDRLTYIFPILPKEKIVETATPGMMTLSDQPLGKSFVVKVLTFKRDNDSGQPDHIMQGILDKVNNGQQDHRLLKFLYNENKFVEVNNDDALLDPDAKTLLLIHGTFSSTENSFKGLLSPDYSSRSWLQKTMEEHGYLQILSLDHPTITYDAEGNVNELKAILNGISFSNNPNLDIVTTSRGGLVGKYIACCLTDNQIPVRKMATIACASGVGYFDTGKNIAKFLSISKDLLMADGSLLAAAVAGFAQFSAEYFLNMPGCQQMTINNPRLTNIISKNPSAANQHMLIQPIVGDWDASLVASDGLVMRLIERGLDVLTKLSLGEQNDWVVGMDKQKICPAGFSNPPVQVHSMHLHYLEANLCPDHVHEKLWAFFDAPTHENA